MRKIKKIMNTNVLTLLPETSIAEAAGFLLEKRINGAPVINESGELVGILCQSDLIAQQKKFPVPSVFTLLDGIIPLRSNKSLEKEISKLTAITVAHAMTPKPVTMSPENTLEDVATLMVKKKFHTIPVVDQGKLVGVLGKEDVLRTLME